MKKMRFVFYPFALNERNRNLKVAKFFPGADRGMPRGSSSKFLNETAEPTISADIIRAESPLALRRVKPRLGFCVHRFQTVPHDRLKGRTLRTSLIVILSMVSLVLAGCHGGPKSAKGFRLPDGNVENGKAAFLALQCNNCHRVNGLELPMPVATAPTNIVIGGEVTVIRTYGELVTSVINPSHGLAPGFKKEQIKEGKLSPMPDFNDLMTVRQMIDLVAFLQSRYKEFPPDYY